MGKSSAKKSAKSGAPDLLAPVVQIFARGDYLRARAELAKLSEVPDLAEGERRQVKELLDATRVEKGTLLVGLGCLGLFALVLLVTFLTQP